MAERRSAVAAANSSAFPVCEAHSTTTSRRGAVGGSPAAGVPDAGASRAGVRGFGAREYMPASTPFTHSACSSAKGAPGGSTGTPAGPGPSPARKPTRYLRSCAARTGGCASASPKSSGSAGATAAGTAAGTTTGAGAGSGGAAGARSEGASAVATVTVPPTRVSSTAHTLNSGWKEIGSTASLVTALTLRYSPNRSFQWKGAKQHPGRTRSVTTAGSTARPRREATSTASPSAMPSRAASCGCTSTKGAGLSLLSLPTFPVLVSVCH